MLGTGNLTWVSVQFQVSADQDGERLDRLVAKGAGVSRRIARVLIAQGKVRVRGKLVKILSRTIKAGARIDVEADASPEAPARATVEALWLDKYLLVVNKPAGLLSETGRESGPSLETEAPALLRNRGEHKSEVKLVHRLDAGTSGVLVLGRTPMATKTLNQAFADGRVHKTYLALCAGRLKRAERIDAPIGRVRGVRHGVVPNGKAAVTRVEAVASAGEFTLVRARPETGRTHQIRVHLAHLGHPLLGDGLYEGPRYTADVPPEPIGRVMLHALRLELRHPKSGEPMTFEAPPPSDFRALARALGVWREP